MLSRPISRFWVYLVVVLGGVSFLPLDYDIKSGSHLPLATLYVNQLGGGEKALLWHVIASVLIAGIVFSIDRLVVTRFFRANGHSSDEPGPNHGIHSND
jgi:hypothetical protein